MDELLRTVLPHEGIAVLHHINAALARWARRKYKRLRYRKTASVHWLGRLARRDPSLLYLWQIGIRPSAGRQKPDEARASRPVS